MQGATFDEATDSLEALRNRGDSAWITANLGSLNDLSEAEVNAQVDTALEDIHLDHLFAVDYNPGSKPGTSTALLNELVESDSGVSRFTANALEQGPSGGGGTPPTVEEIRAEIDTNSVELAAIKGFVDDIGSAGAGLTNLPWNSAWDAEIESEVDDALGVGGVSLTAIPWNSAWDSEVQSEVADALDFYDPPTKAEMDTGHDALPTAVEIRDSVMQYALDNGLTFEQAVCHAASVLFGESDFTAGSPDQTVFSDHSGTDVRVTVEYGSDSGDRTSVTLSATNCGSN